VALSFVFSFLYGLTRNVVRDHDNFLQEDKEWDGDERRYEASINLHKKRNETAKEKRNQRVRFRTPRLYDAQDLLGTYVTLSAIHTWSEYVFDLSNYARAWYILLLPIALTTLVYGSSITQGLVTGSGLASILDQPAPEPAEIENEYLAYVAESVSYSCVGGISYAH
jgi:hypothetical protein